MTLKPKLTVTSKCEWLVWRTKDLILLCLNYSRHFIFTVELPRALSCRGTTSLVQQRSTNMIFEMIFEKWQNKDSGLFCFCPVSNFFLFSSSSPLMHPTSFFMLHVTPVLQHPGNPWGFLPSAEVPGIATHPSPSLHQLCPRATAKNV